MSITEDFHDDGAPLDGDLDDAPQQGIWASNYGKVRGLGWIPLALPEGRKAMPMGKKDAPLYRSLTGYSGVDADASELAEITRVRGANANIATRAPQAVQRDGVLYDLVFVDVDQYMKGGHQKNGAATILDVEKRAGVQFPATCAVGSRGDGDVSKKYAYLIPHGEKLVTELPDVDLVQWFHRYAVIPPSTNPEAGGAAFRAYRGVAPRADACAAEPINGMFAPQDATVLPAELLAELRDTRGFANVTDADTEQVREFLAALPVDPDQADYRCKATAGALDAGLLALRSDNRHGSARGAVIRLLRIGHMGHVGVPSALETLRQAYISAVSGDRPEKTATAEFGRLIKNPRGIGMILGEPTAEEDRGCRCSLQLTDDEILGALEDEPEMASDLRHVVGAERYTAVLAAAGIPDPLTARTNGHASPAATGNSAPEASTTTEQAPPAQQQAEETPVGQDRQNGAEPAGPAPSEPQPGQRDGIPALHSFTMDDRGNGQRFIAVWGDDVAWVPDEKTTRVWLGSRWEADTGARMRHLAHRMTDFMLVESRARLGAAQRAFDALDADDPAKVEAKAELDKAKAYAKWTAASRMDAKLKACVVSAVANPGTSVKSGQWDSDPRLLNVGNGTLRLELDGSATFGPHRRDDRLTQQAGVEFDRHAKAPQWEAFLLRALPDPAVRRVLRAVIGLSLVGNNSSHVFPVLIGEPRSGKTTVTEVIAGVLDNADEPSVAYSGSFSLSDLRPKHGNGPNPTLYRIVRRRFVYCSESNDGLALNADLVKRFSGGDRQNARDTYGRASAVSDRAPSFTPFLATNKAPEVEGADQALRERLIAIVFAHTVPANERDPHLTEKLLTEASGILNWALDGYRDVMRNPHVIRDLPESSVEAAEEMYRSMNLYQRWLSDETEPAGEDDQDRWITVEESWQAFTAWCVDQRETSGTKHKFGLALAAEGYRSRVCTIKSGSAVERRREGLAWNAEHVVQQQRESARRMGTPRAQDGDGLLDDGVRV